MVYSENILICIAIPLLIALLFTKRSTRGFLIAFIVGMVTCLLSAYMNGFIRVVCNIEADDMSVFYAPIVEELMKLMPVLFFVFVFLPKDDSLLIATLGIGLGFATFENCCYILSDGASILPYVMVRGMAVGVMHLVCALYLALGLRMAKRIHGISLPSVVGALSLSMVFHGTYNLLVSEPGLSTYIGYSIPVITAVSLYIPYRKAVGNESRKAQ